MASTCSRHVVYNMCSPCALTNYMCCTNVALIKHNICLRNVHSLCSSCALTNNRPAIFPMLSGHKCTAGVYAHRSISLRGYMPTVRFRLAKSNGGHIPPPCIYGPIAWDLLIPTNNMCRTNVALIKHNICLCSIHVPSFSELAFNVLH